MFDYLMSMDGVNTEKTAEPGYEQLSTEEKQRLESIKLGNAWPTVEYLTSHPRVVNAVLSSPEGIEAMKILVEKAVKPEQRKKLLTAAKALIKEKADSLEIADTISTASIFAGGVLGTGASLLAVSHFVLQDEFGTDPKALSVDLILAFVLIIAAVIVLGIGGLASKATKAPHQRLESVFEELFGDEWKKARKGADNQNDSEAGPSDNPYQYL